MRNDGYGGFGAGLGGGAGLFGASAGGGAGIHFGGDMDYGGGGTSSSTYGGVDSTTASVAASSSVLLLALASLWYFGRGKPQQQVEYVSRCTTVCRSYPSSEMRCIHIAASRDASKIPALSDLLLQASRFPSSERLKMELTSIMEKYRVPGALVSVRQLGKPLAEFPIGYATISREGPLMQMDMNFRIGSVTKSMTATTIMILVERGDLKLNDPLSKWFPDFPNASKITLLNMMNMTSGLGDYGQNPTFATIYNAYPQINWVAEDLCHWIKEQGSMFEPGARWHYNNSGFVLLGKIIHMTTGLKIKKAYRKYLWDPLGMSCRTIVPKNAVIPVPHAHGYGNYREKFEDVTDWNPRVAFSAGIVISNIDDMQLWAQNIGNATLLKAWKTNVAETLLHQDSVNTPESDDAFQANTFFYGFGVMYDHEWVWHNGSIPGFETVCAYYRPLDISVVISINQNTLPEFLENGKEKVVNEMFRRIVDMYTPLSELSYVQH